MPQYPSDDQLLRQLRDPSVRRAAFETVVAKFSSRLYWQIRHTVTFHDDANDVLQNTFLKAWQALDNFRGDAMLSTWLFRIAANESLSFLEQRRDNLSLDSAELNLGDTLESDPYFDGDETEKQLQQALAELPPKQRQVFTLRYYDQMKYEEMSEILGTSVGALKASYHIAVKKIEEFFDSHD
ncbi:MAG: sigma-70 family RNA polymerase sigma factor [Bacteroidaceae bacterium]|nr:sigma-70 family RNA polymerase sigma factor [Bacteroidaceae bacterium]